MQTIKGPINYQKPTAVPAMTFGTAIEKLSKPKPRQADPMPSLDVQRQRLVMERDRLLREARRLENVLWGLDRAIEILSSDGQQGGH